jgi:hypothetical protein
MQMFCRNRPRTGEKKKEKKRKFVCAVWFVFDYSRKIPKIESAFRLTRPKVSRIALVRLLDSLSFL